MTFACRFLLFILILTVTLENLNFVFGSKSANNIEILKAANSNEQPEVQLLNQIHQNNTSENDETEIVSEPNEKKIPLKSKGPQSKKKSSAYRTRRNPAKAKHIRVPKKLSFKDETNTSKLVEDDVDTKDEEIEEVVEKNSEITPDTDSNNVIIKEESTTSNSLANEPLQIPSTEEEYEEYDENEVENLRSILTQLQMILLFIAGVTFLCILIYAVYYINLIRKIYTDKELVSK